MSFDLASFYMERKQYLSNLKRKRSNSSLLFQRTINVLVMEVEDGLKEEVEQEFVYLSSKDKINSNSTFDERFQKYLEQLERNTKYY